MTPILAFDIETIPDIAGLRRTHDLPPGLSDDGVLDWYTQRRRAISSASAWLTYSSRSTRALS